MSVTKVLLMLGALGASAEPSFCQTFVGVDFEQLASPSGCVRKVTVPPTSAPAIPALKLPGVTISGGQVLSYQNPFQFSPNNVYSTFNGCAGEQPAITITFEGPASGVNLVIGNFWNAGESLQAQDDRGFNQTINLSSSATAGITLFFPEDNIRRITLTLPASVWTASSPAGFYIDNLDFYLQNDMEFVDPVPDLMSGTGLVSDPETLATGGTLVRAVAADGVARVLLAAQANHPGDMVTFTVINDRGNPSNSTQEDGGLSSVTGSQSSRQQAVRVAAQDGTQGPMAFAVYYPPPDFSRGSQDDQSAGRAIQIQVETPGPNTPSYRRSLTILRPPVVLVHDLWEEPADWDAFTPLINDARFFIRRAAYNSVLGNRISASMPTFPGANLAHARESALGVGYNSPAVLTQIAQYVNEFRSVQNAAAAQADVVVHGMGGVLARAGIQLANYAAPESYGLGSVNKLITLGTPHLGTPLASALLRNENSCFASILAAGGKFSFAGATVDNASVTGGVGDLQGNGFGGGLSPALAQIQQSGNQTAPAAFLAGMMNNASTSSLDDPLSVSRFIRLACGGSPLASSLSSNGWFGVFGQPSDGMVPFTSQLSGIFGQAMNGIVHSEGMEQLGFNPSSELDNQTPVGTAVINLLNTQVRSNSFHPIP